METELGSAFIQAVSLRTKACNGVLTGFYAGGYANDISLNVLNRRWVRVWLQLRV